VISLISEFEISSGFVFGIFTPISNKSINQVPTHENKARGDSLLSMKYFQPRACFTFIIQVQSNMISGINPKYLKIGKSNNTISNTKTNKNNIHRPEDCLR
jgi:hypothetical protein